MAGDAPPARIEEWRRGRTIRLPAQLRRPARYLNPGAGDQEVALARRGTTLVGSVKSAMLVQVVSSGGIGAETAADLRLRIRRIVDRSVGAHSARSAAIVRAILLGDRAGLDDETEERLQEAGTYHVIAISGGNIAVLAALLMAAARLAGLRAGVAHVVVAAILCGYAFLVGGGSSVVRATQMAVLYLVARAVDHRARPYNSIGASAATTCALDPLSVCDAGAWLTYGATAAILAGTPLAPGTRAGDVACGQGASRPVRGVGLGRTGALPRERAGVFARDGGGAVAELRGDPADVRGPGRRNGAGGGPRAGAGSGACREPRSRTSLRGDWLKAPGLSR